MASDEMQIQELKSLWPQTAAYVEEGQQYFYMPDLVLPAGCTPTKVHALLCDHQRDGYPSRLYFSQIIASTRQQNWNTANVYIIGKAWFAFSWNVDPKSARLSQIVRSFLRGLE